MLDNSAQRIMGSSNGITHVHEAALGQFLAVLVLLFGKVQVLHGLVGQPGIVERRAISSGTVVRGLSCVVWVPGTSGLSTSAE